MPEIYAEKGKQEIQETDEPLKREAITIPKMMAKGKPKKMNSQNILIREEIYTIRESLGLYICTILYVLLYVYIAYVYYYN